MLLYLYLFCYSVFCCCCCCFTCRLSDAHAYLKAASYSSPGFLFIYTTVAVCTPTFSGFSYEGMFLHAFIIMCACVSAVTALLLKCSFVCVFFLIHSCFFFHYYIYCIPLLSALFRNLRHILTLLLLLLLPTNNVNKT